MRVVVAEDNALLRDGIVLVLGDHEIDVVAAVIDRHCRSIRDWGAVWRGRSPRMAS